jgi:hypothetical protein
MSRIWARAAACQHVPSSSRYPPSEVPPVGRLGDISTSLTPARGRAGRSGGCALPRLAHRSSTRSPAGWEQQISALPSAGSSTGSGA